MNNSVPIIIDNGTSRLRVGFANEDTPRALVPSVIGRPRVGQTAMAVGVEDGEAGYIGEEALSRKSVLDVTCPIEKGIVTNWDDMEEVGPIVYNHYCIAIAICSYNWPGWEACMVFRIETQKLW